MQSAPVESSRVPEYEFDEKQNIVIGDCGGRAQVWGVLCMLAGAVQIVASGLNIAGLIKGNGYIFVLPAGIFNVVLGVYFSRAGKTLKSVVETQGSDITLMLTALGSFSRALLIQIVATCVFILSVLATIGFMIAMMRFFKS